MEDMGHSLKNAVDSNVWRSVRVARNSPGISHIFFVNDLLLFGEASFSQARVIEHVVAEFYGISG